MQRKHLIATTVAIVILIGSGAVIGAQERPSPERPMPNMEQMPGGMMGGGMMGGGMMGMMDMMATCSRMMGSGMAGAGVIPQLPPGNEKLQLQMHAEIMQRVGEILSKYAAKVEGRQAGER